MLCDKLSIKILLMNHNYSINILGTQENKCTTYI